ncbi:MAG: AMP-binding protein, partial [Acidimicrobiales bacterium]
MDISKEQLDNAVRGQTIVSRYLDTVAAHPQQVALREKQPDGSYSQWTYAEHAERVASVAARLRSMGVVPGDRVVLMMRNIPDFHFIDLGVT